MSFQNQGLWVGKTVGATNDSMTNYENFPRIELKRSHQWFMDGSDSELFSNKKQAVGVPTNSLFSGLLNSNVSPWGNLSGFQSISGHFSDRSFDPEIGRPANFDDRSIPSLCSEKANMESKVDEDPFGNDSSFGLSMSHMLEDPRSGLNYGGIRKVKVSQVKESENIIMPVSLESNYNRVQCNNMMSTLHAYDKTDESNTSGGLAYSKGEDNIMSMGETEDRACNIFISMGQPYSKGDDSMSTYVENDNAAAIHHTFSNGDVHLMSMGQPYKPGENTISMGILINKGNHGTSSMGQTHKGDDNNISVSQCHNKGESTIISFGGHDDDDDESPSWRLISTYDLLMAQPSLQSSEVINEREVINSNADTLVSATHMTVSGTENANKNEYLKTSKKVPSNNFPSNVRSLLSTGILDGVSVKYIAWSREKELRGVIKGTGYSCGCQTCNFSKVINAYEFERHANCKTKHPNNHIYFENGKTVYGIVQELRNTPQTMLFDVIQTITGSPINQKSFRLWKESFLAATRELQRIYGKDEGKPL